MQKPEMILFDYGDTLLYEPEFDGIRGMKALFPYMTKNLEKCSGEVLAAESATLFAESAPVRGMGFELHEWPLNRLLFESHGIEFSISEELIEQIFWMNACPGAVVPYADELLDFLNAQGIRTGVVSNIGWSGRALTHRLNRLLPRNSFEFVLTSADYMVRKPDSRLFKVACRKAKLAPEKIWFCGDNFRCDVEAAGKIGMTPVWYQPGMVENLSAVHTEPLCIDAWTELIKIVKELST